MFFNSDGPTRMTGVADDGLAVMIIKGCDEYMRLVLGITACFISSFEITVPIGWFPVR